MANFPLLQTDLPKEQERYHRTLIATMVNELIKARRPLTAEEIDQGVTPVDFSYPPGNVLSYGASTGGIDNSTSAVEDAIRVNDVIVFQPGITFRFNAEVSKSVTIIAHGATLKPFAAGEMFNCTGLGTRVQIYGGHIDMTGFLSTSGAFGDVGIFGDAIESLEVFGTRFTSGAFPIVADSCGLFRVHACVINDPDRWGVYGLGCDDVIYTENVVKGTVFFDGLKVAGTESPDALKPSGRIIITDNVCCDNANDGIDVAINGAEIVNLDNNTGSGNGGRLIDFKILTHDDGSTGVTLCSIKGNVAVTTANDPVLINAQDNLNNDNIKHLTIEDNELYVDGGSSVTAIRVLDINRAKINGNRCYGAFYGVRVQGSDDCEVFDNTILACIRGVMLEVGSAAAAPNRTKVHDNYIRPKDHPSGFGNGVFVDAGDANEVYENRFDMDNSRYSVAYETNSATSATNTMIGRNLRGFATAIPTGNRAIPGDYWINGTISQGSPSEWLCNAITSSTTTTNLRAHGQVGYRTSAGAPSVNANFIGERLFDTTNTNWYTAVATGTGASDWKKDSP